MSTERPSTSPSQPSDIAHARPKHLPLITAREPPELVPARMLNEVTYCERLMFLEWVQGEFEDNYFTVDGRTVHERADASGGRLPEPAAPDASAATHEASEPDDDGQEDGVSYHARSVWLSSEQLGITAKIDVVEGSAAAEVVPIEYKRGKAPDLPEGAYLPERVQLCAHVLLLREHGFRCDRAAIYFAKSKRRVEIEISQALIERTLWAVRRAREVAICSEPPAPLVDDPKCRGCSLSGICLPDEVNLLLRLKDQPIIDPVEDDGGLTGPLEPDPWGIASGPDPAESRPIRRLYAALDERLPLYVNEHGAQIGLSGERLIIRTESGPRHVRLMNTSQVVVRGNVQLTTQAARALLDRGIPVIYLSGGGWFTGRLIGTDTNNVDLRIAQFRAEQDATLSLELARAFVTAKIRNCRTLLRRNDPKVDEMVLRQLKQLTRKAAREDSMQSLLGIEGAAAREYFRSFSGMLKVRGIGSFDFERRNRRPPRDPINALLSFAYALLTKDLVIATAGVGLDPLLGFYHQPRFGRPALALDLMEEFRPLLADSTVINVINNGIVSSDDFVTLAKTCSLKDQARARVIDAYERRIDQTILHPIFGYSVSYRRVLELQARLLSRVIMGELTNYPAFVTR